MESLTKTRTLRIILGLLIGIIVFALGYFVGQAHGMHERPYGGHMQTGAMRGNWQPGQRPGMPMASSTNPGGPMRPVQAMPAPQNAPAAQ